MWFICWKTFWGEEEHVTLKNVLSLNFKNPLNFLNLQNKLKYLKPFQKYDKFSINVIANTITDNKIILPINNLQTAPISPTTNDLWTHFSSYMRNKHTQWSFVDFFFFEMEKNRLTKLFWLHHKRFFLFTSLTSVLSILCLSFWLYRCTHMDMNIRTYLKNGNWVWIKIIKKKSFNCYCRLRKLRKWRR